MSGHSREQALSLLAAAKNHGDLAVKLSSLRQVKVILSSMDPFLAAELFPYLSELQSSSASLVRKLLIEVVEEIGLKLLEHSSLVMPVLLLLSKDSDPVVSRQSIVSCMKFLCTALDKMALQFHKHGKVERWAEEIWTWMLRFKDAMYSFLFESVSVGMKLLALQYLEIYILLLTPDMNDSDKFTSGGKEHAFNISMLFNGHPFLDPVVLKAESNKFLFTLLDLLRSKNSLPGPLTICVVNCSRQV